MLIPPKQYREAGWKITTVGDDIAWMWRRPERRPALRDQSGGRLLRRRARHQLQQTNPNAMAMHVARHDLHQRRAAARWRCLVGRQDAPSRPPNASTGRASPGRPPRRPRPAHPNSRFTAPMTNNPALDPAANDPNGVPISRASSSAAAAPRRIPLVYPGLQLDSRRLRRRDARLAKRPPPPPGRSASSAAIRWPCCRSAATTSATISSTGSACARR